MADDAADDSRVAANVVAYIREDANQAGVRRAVVTRVGVPQEVLTRRVDGCPEDANPVGVRRVDGCRAGRVWCWAGWRVSSPVGWPVWYSADSRVWPRAACLAVGPVGYWAATKDATPGVMRALRPGAKHWVACGHRWVCCVIHVTYRQTGHLLDQQKPRLVRETVA